MGLILLHLIAKKRKFDGQMFLQECFGFPHPVYGHVPMLLAPDGRRLSKRDRDMDLGILRENYRPEALLGKLAFSAGLLDKDQPISANELVSLFSWKKLCTDSIYLNL